MMIGEGVTLHCYIRVIVGCQATRELLGGAHVGQARENPG